MYNQVRAASRPVHSECHTQPPQAFVLCHSGLEAAGGGAHSLQQAFATVTALGTQIKDAIDRAPIPTPWGVEVHSEVAELHVQVRCLQWGSHTVCGQPWSSCQVLLSPAVSAQLHSLTGLKLVLAVSCYFLCRTAAACPAVVFCSRPMTLSAAVICSQS